MLGYSLWSQKRYADAETQLTQVVAKYPNSKRASYAQNLLGRAYLDDGQLVRAAEGLLRQLQAVPARRPRARQPLLSRPDADPAQEERPRPARPMASSSDVYGATANPTLKARVAQGRADAKCGA